MKCLYLLCLFFLLKLATAEANTPKPNVCDLEINPITVTEFTGYPNDNQICSGFDVVFSTGFSSGGGSGAWSWSASPSGFINFVDTTVPFTGAACSNTTGLPVTVTVSVTFVRDDECFDTETTTVVIYPTMSVLVGVSDDSGTPNDGGVCFGDYVTMAANVTGGTPSAYLWEQAGQTTQSITFQPPYDNQPHLYIVTVTDAAGCQALGFGSAKGVTEIAATAEPVASCGNDHLYIEVSGGVPAPAGYLFLINGNPVGEFHHSPWQYPVFGSPGETIEVSFEIRDEKGCVAFLSASIILPDDSDGDGDRDDCDNCPDVSNANQVDADNDGVGNACDNCFMVSNPDQTDSDFDNFGDECEDCDFDPEKTSPGICGCNVPDTDSDGDGTPDCNDDCPFDSNLIQFLTWYYDADYDTYGNPSSSVQACSEAPGYTQVGGDCNDSNGSIHPGATEICNGVDDDCDGNTDNGSSPISWFFDWDNDGFGNPSVSQTSCTPPNGFVANDDDCNDGSNSTYPGATEICNDIDDDCDGLVDDGLGTNQYWADGDNDGYGNPSFSLWDCNQPAGYATNSTDCNDGNSNVNPSISEICNAQDDNCNGQIDEGASTSTYYFDYDNDAHGNSSLSLSACSAPPGWVLIGDDCNDGDNQIYPGHAEVNCNSQDDDCDGLYDEGNNLNVNLTKANPLCNNQNNGSISLSVSGGPTPYTYLWSDGVTTKNRSGLPAGSYSVVVTAANGCTKAVYTVLDNPTPVELFYGIQQTSTTPPRWRVTLIGSGGTQYPQPTPYRYRKNSGSWGSGNVFNNNTAGTYTFSVRDKNLCQTSVLVTLGGSAKPPVLAEGRKIELPKLAEPLSNVHLFPNPTFREVNLLVSEMPDNQGFVSITDVWGIERKRLDLAALKIGEPLNIPLDGDFKPGVYFLNFQPTNARKITKRFVVSDF